jgi:hypothetical protein
LSRLPTKHPSARCPHPRRPLRHRPQRPGLTCHLHPHTRPPPRPPLPIRHHAISLARLWQLSLPSAHQDFPTPRAPLHPNSSRWPRTNSRAGSSTCLTTTTNPTITTITTRIITTATATATATGPHYHRPVPRRPRRPPPQKRQQQKQQQHSVHTHSTPSHQKS